MFTLHTWSTPNGKKPVLFLEEVEAPYQVVPVDIGADQQFNADFLALNPNHKIPVLVDDAPKHGGDPVVLFESGAILMYLAEKYGAFFPEHGMDRYRVVQWVMFQMGGIGPMFGQAGHFLRRREPIAEAIDRYVGEVKRLYGVLNTRLGEVPFLAGDEYTIADMMSYPWVYKPQHFGLTLDAYPRVAAWVDRVGQREAVLRAMAVDLRTSHGVRLQEAP